VNALTRFIQNIARRELNNLALVADAVEGVAGHIRKQTVLNGHGCEEYPALG
jgi:hypothetical protein